MYLKTAIQFSFYNFTILFAYFKGLYSSNSKLNFNIKQAGDKGIYLQIY